MKNPWLDKSAKKESYTAQILAHRITERFKELLNEAALTVINDDEENDDDTSSACNCHACQFDLWHQHAVDQYEAMQAGDEDQP